ncbi:MAG TPA: hypothetical protein VG986_11710 [Pseudolabrys sp.]|nr:hypothetical protein [Pseudolabrys sp.]
MREWATRKLRHGDLTALGTVRRGVEGVQEDRLGRLERRGFVAKKGNGKFVVTIPGRLALLVRSLTPR